MYVCLCALGMCPSSPTSLSIVRSSFDLFALGNRLGNEHFVAKRYAQAVECYSRAIDISPSNHLLFGNRRSVSAPRKHKTSDIVVYSLASKETSPRNDVCAYSRGPPSMLLQLLLWILFEVHVTFEPCNSYPYIGGCLERRHSHWFCCRGNNVLRPFSLDRVVVL